MIMLKSASSWWNMQSSSPRNSRFLTSAFPQKTPMSWKILKETMEWARVWPNNLVQSLTSTLNTCFNLVRTIIPHCQLVNEKNLIASLCHSHQILKVAWCQLIANGTLQADISVLGNNQQSAVKPLHVTVIFSSNLLTFLHCFHSYNLRLNRVKNPAGKEALKSATIHSPNEGALQILTLSPATCPETVLNRLSGFALLQWVRIFIQFILDLPSVSLIQ